MTIEQKFINAKARRDRAGVLLRELYEKTEEQRRTAVDAYHVIYNECLALAAQKAEGNS